jgi:hypothetical protein
MNDERTPDRARHQGYARFVPTRKQLENAGFGFKFGLAGVIVFFTGLGILFGVDVDGWGSGLGTMAIGAGAAAVGYLLILKAPRS